MRETRRAPQDEPTDDLDDLGLDLYDPDDSRYHQTPPPQPHILLQTGHWDSPGYSANSYGNTYSSSYAHYDNNQLDYSSWPPLDSFQGLSLGQPPPESSAQYNLNAINPAFPQYAPYRNATLSPEDAIPASFQAHFGHYPYPNGSSAPPTLVQEVTSASSHLPPTPKGPSTVKSSESAKRYSCDRCPQRFKQRKDLDRHTPIHNPVPDGQKIKGRYLCWCGKGDHRKDNHKRHVEKCEKNGGNNFVCQCLFETSSKQQHKDHIGRCREGSNPVGRPARSRATPSVTSWED